MQKIPNFASLIGIWVNEKYVWMRAPVNLFMRSVSKQQYHRNIKISYNTEYNNI